MHIQNSTGESTSAAALREVLRDSHFLEKQTAIILALHFGGPSTSDELASITGLRDVYIRPRLTAMLHFGILEIAGRSTQMKSRRFANKLRIAQPWASMLSECPDGELEFLTRVIYLETKAEFEANQIENALATGLI